MKKLSVAMATFNEEENLGACLESVKNLADEIVIVDGGSVDQTRTIAKNFGARVIKTTNPAIFHINKQKAIDACHGQWILQLDADERVSRGLRREILGVVSFRSTLEESDVFPATAGSTLPPSKEKLSDSSDGVRSTPPRCCDGYWIPRKNYFLGRYLTKGGQYPDFTLRLYRRGKGRLPCQSVHEQAVVDGPVGYLKNDLLHQADPSFSRYWQRFQRYTDLIADELTQQKLAIKPLNFLNYLLFKPLKWFFSTYLWHKGFVDSWQGLVFSFFSSLRFAFAYIKYWQKGYEKKT